MKPTQTLPENYTQAWRLDLKSDKKLNWLLQVVATIWFLLLLGMLAPFYLWLRPEIAAWAAGRRR